MKEKKDNRLIIFLILLIVAGTVSAVSGIYLVDAEEKSTFERIHDFDRSELQVEETKSTIYGSTYPIFMQLGEDIMRQPAAERGFTAGEVMRWAGVVSIIIALIILFSIEFIYKDRVRPGNYRMLMIVSLFVLPLIIGLGTTVTVLETTKTVESCQTCHVMDPFVFEMEDPHGTSLAARHYKNQWIAENQCYQCHTTYGAQGDLEGKRDGFRHWFLFVTELWEEPITYAGSYPNQNCTACHSGTRRFLEVDSHVALADRMRADEVSCTSCHGPAHPVPKERHRYMQVDVDEVASVNRSKPLDNDELAKILEAIDGSK